MVSTLTEHAATCLKVEGATVLDPDDPSGPSSATLHVVDGRIATPDQFEAARRAGAAVQRIDATNHLLVPGFVNAHTHSPLNILKGTGDVLSHPAFMWLNQADTASRTPDEIRLSALLGCIEHLTAGTTSVVDHFPEQGFSLADVDAVVDAYRLAGMRALIALRVFDESYDDIIPPGGLPPDLATANPLKPPLLDESVALVEAAITQHHGAANGRIAIGPGPSNPMRCSDALLTQMDALAVKHETAVHTHLLETEVQTRIAAQRYGTTMIKHLDRSGVLSPRLSCAHTIWLDDDDIALLAERGTMVVHNPESNLKIGAGIAPVARMLQAGVTVALGTDGASTNDNLDMHETMRLAAMLQRPLERDRSRWPTARDAWAMATLAGGRVMRVPGLGSLAAGAPADFVLHDLGAAAWTPLNDPVAQLVFTATGSTIRTVVVDGRVLVRDGTIVAFDASAVLSEARGLVKSLRARNAALHGIAARLRFE